MKNPFEGKAPTEEHQRRAAGQLEYWARTDYERAYLIQQAAFALAAEADAPTLPPASWEECPEEIKVVYRRTFLSLVHFVSWAVKE